MEKRECHTRSRWLLLFLRITEAFDVALGTFLNTVYRCVFTLRLQSNGKQAEIHQFNLISSFPICMRVSVE